MRQIVKIFFPALILFLTFSCENGEWEFPDYKFSGTYFPYQTPVRTLVLGDDNVADNTKDNNLQFSIGVTMGGVYENNRDVKVGYAVDETLVSKLYSNKNDTIVALPKAYYTLSPTGSMTIPKGQMTGYIDVQLTDAFLNDPRAHKLRYVIPLVLTSTETDSILQGKAAVANPDRRIAANWAVLPKDYTLFAIKYINPYHGQYLHRGKNIVKDAAGTQVDQVVYRTKFIEDNEIWSLTTTKRNQVLVTGAIRRTAGSPGNFKALLTFDNSGNCTVTSDPTSAYPVTGTGKFVKEGDTWGGKKRNAIIINYQVTDSKNAQFHNATDTLVIRDRAVVLETFTPVVK